MAIIRSGWVLQRLIVMVLQPLTLTWCCSHASGGILDLLMTDVPVLIWVAVVAPIGNSDHSSLSAVISTAQAVPNLCVSRKVFLKHQVSWNTVCGAMWDLPWHNIWSSDNPVEVLNEHLSLLIGRYVPTKIIHVRNKENPWFDDQCRRAFDLKQEAHLWWTRDHSWVNWEEFVLCQDRVNETYSEAKHQFSVRNIDVLMNVQTLLSGGPLLSPLCSARVRHCLLWSVRVGDWCVSHLARLICCQIILTAHSPGSLLICWSLAIRLLV